VRPDALGEQLLGAAEWRLLSLLLSRPNRAWRAEVAAVAAEVQDGDLRAAAEAAEAAGEGAYHALLGPGGPASAREAAHAGFLDPGRLLADLSTRYRAFAFAPRGEEPEDHLAVECDFAAFLHLKEAWALARADAEAAAVTREARARFLEDHLAAAGHGFARKLPAGTPTWLEAAARALCARLPEPAAPPAAACDTGDDPLAGGCPAAGACGEA
jgi:nitrate reductase assembly molybdenum cofactor insertion protein NarJ